MREESLAASKKPSISKELSTYLSPDKVGVNQIPDHYRGNVNARHTMIEYADYICPHCVELASHMEKLYQEYGSKVLFIYRHYSINFKYSDVAAKISEAAYVVGGEQAFWSISKQLFADQSFSDDREVDVNAEIYRLANSIKLDPAALLNAYNNSANNGIDQKLARDQKLGLESKVPGTPTVFMDRFKIDGNHQGIKSALANSVK